MAMDFSKYGHKHKANCAMPDYAYMYPIPYQYYEKYKIRRYGFHGTSHRYVSAEMTKILGKVEGSGFFR